MDEILEELKKLAADESGVSIRELEGKQRPVEVTSVRQVYCFLAYRYGFSYAAIARSINRDTSSVRHAIKMGRRILVSKQTDTLILRGYARRIGERLEEFEMEII